MNLARRRAEGMGGYFADQFENEENWRCHERSTGVEIYRQCGGKLDAFVSGAGILLDFLTRSVIFLDLSFTLYFLPLIYILFPTYSSYHMYPSSAYSTLHLKCLVHMLTPGTGGTITGISSYLLPRLPNLLVVLADPQGSGLYNSIKYGVMYSSTEKEGTRRRHQVDSLVEGIGLNRLTRNFERGKGNIHEAVKVTDEMAVGMGRWLIQNDGPLSQPFTYPPL